MRRFYIRHERQLVEKGCQARLYLVYVQYGNNAPVNHSRSFVHRSNVVLRAVVTTIIVKEGLLAQPPNDHLY